MLRMRVAGVFALLLFALSAQSAFADTRIVDQLLSDGTEHILQHWGTRFVSPASTTVRSIALGVSAPCGAVALGHLENKFRPLEFFPDGIFPDASPILGGYRFTGGSVPLQASTTYYILNSATPSTRCSIDISRTASSTIAQNAQIYLIDADGFWLAQDASVFGSPVRDIKYSVCSDATCSLLDATVTAPVIIIPGILGSAQHNGQWLIDPITHSYDNLIDTLAANGYQKDVNLFPFPYDWHKSNIDTAVLLKKKIDEVKAICGCDKVDIVAHSMGGLVARQYVQSNYYGHDVRKLLFLGTPHLGAPKAYLMWEGGQEDIDREDQLIKFFLRIEAREKGYPSLFAYERRFPISSVQELLPVYGYIKHVGSSDIPAYPNNLWYPSNPFLESLNNSINTVYNVGTDITNFAGNLASSTTISTIRVTNAIASSTAKWGYGFPENFGNSSTDQGLERGVGDGTVPLSSSQFVNGDLQIIDSEHNDLPSKTESEVFKKLTGRDPITLVNNNHGLFETAKNILVFQILSPADMQIVAPDGKVIGKDFTTGQEINQIPDAFYSGFGADDEFATIPHPLDGQYKVITQGTGAGGGYTIAAGVIADAISSETFFTSQILPNQIIQQYVQVDTVNPSNTKITPADFTPPTITFNQPIATIFTHSGLMPVNLTFADGSGVATTSVSFNGRSIAASTTIDLFFESLGTASLIASGRDVFNNAATSTKTIQIIATFDSTRSDINRVLALGWTTQAVRNLFLAELNTAALARSINDKIKRLQTMLNDLNTMRKVRKINQQGYQILSVDVNWLISH